MSLTDPLGHGAKLGPYTILQRIGAGGMGEVYKANDPKLTRDVAIKVVRPEFLGASDRLARIQREARILASLNHPHIAAIYGLEDSGGAPALVMELVDGPTVADWLLSGPVPVEECLRIAIQIAEGLEFAHERGIVHRDLKPANVKVTAGGTVKILDFGLAKALAPEVGEHHANPSTISHLGTEAGIVLGTPAYMSPEQASGRPVDRRTDVWAFGCLFYEILTGTRAFSGETTTDTLAAVMRSEPDWSRLPRAIRRRFQPSCAAAFEKIRASGCRRLATRASPSTKFSRARSAIRHRHPPCVRLEGSGWRSSPVRPSRCWPA